MLSLLKSLCNEPYFGMQQRKSLLQKLCNHLTKPTPDHVSVVGPEQNGRSQLLRELSDFFVEQNDYYFKSIYWNLKHEVFDSDRTFILALAEEVKKALEPVRPDLSQELKNQKDCAGDRLDTIFEILEDEKLRVLVVVDGFDHIVSAARLTPNIWNFLRALAHRRSLRFVTGSRKTLFDICNAERSGGTYLCEMFYDSPIRICTKTLE